MMNSVGCASACAPDQGHAADSLLGMLSSLSVHMADIADEARNLEKPLAPVLKPSAPSPIGNGQSLAEVLPDALSQVDSLPTSARSVVAHLQSMRMRQAIG